MSYLTANLQMLHFIYYSTNIRTEYFKHAAHVLQRSLEYKTWDPNTNKIWSTILKEWTTPESRNRPSTTNLEEEEIADTPGNDGNASMPEQFKRRNPWRKMMMMISVCHLCGFLQSAWTKLTGSTTQNNKTEITYKSTTIELLYYWQI